MYNISQKNELVHMVQDHHIDMLMDIAFFVSWQNGFKWTPQTPTKTERRCVCTTHFEAAVVPPAGHKGMVETL